MKVSYRDAANDDVVRQFRHYLVSLDVPEVAIRFRDAVRRTAQSLCQHPFAGPHFHSGNPVGTYAVFIASAMNPRTVCLSQPMRS